MTGLIDVHCRTGSSESQGRAGSEGFYRSLPDRQLRKDPQAELETSLEFTAGQAAQKAEHAAIMSAMYVHCRTGSSETAACGVDGLQCVHCRTGSSEKCHPGRLYRAGVHCRTGSSENTSMGTTLCVVVHCRTGSSETLYQTHLCMFPVHCRTGSSEMPHLQTAQVLGRSLPDRQLRNDRHPANRRTPRSLPDRQLRKVVAHRPESAPGSLPDRQLRKRSRSGANLTMKFTAGQAAQKFP